ncbi:MAG: carboxypeptidase regulatory-like domain-containing protein, partial [Bacteroidota bacterium]
MPSKHRVRVFSMVAILVLLATRLANIQQVSGTVSDPEGNPIFGVFVTAKNLSTGMAATVVTDSEGWYEMPGLPPGTYRIEAAQIGFDRSRYDSVEIYNRVRKHDFSLAANTDKSDQIPSSVFLNVLPQGERKRKFILDCTGCHQFDKSFVFLEDHPRSRDSWKESTGRMLEWFGPSSKFPIIAFGQDAEGIADWLVRHLSELESAHRTFSKPPPVSGSAQRVMYTEYDFPVPFDLPHDLMVDHDGQIVITGMFSHAMYRLQPTTG